MMEEKWVNHGATHDTTDLEQILEFSKAIREKYGYLHDDRIIFNDRICSHCGQRIKEKDES